MILDAREYGISSIVFHRFKESFHAYVSKPPFLKSFQLWETTNSHAGLPATSLSDQPMEDYYFQLSYGMLIIHNIQQKVSDKLSCPPEIWRLFAWLDEIKNESQFFPAKESWFPAEDLFGELLTDLSHYLHREEHGMFYTPLSLTQLILSNTFENPESGNIQGDILDPTCGTGSFLITLFNTILRNLDPSHPRDKLPTPLLHIFGFDQNPLAVYATLVNLQNIVVNHHQFSAACAQTLSPQFHCLDLFTLFSIKEKHPFFFTTKSSKRYRADYANKKFHKYCDILSEKYPKYRTRLSSLKGMHSLRHMFGRIMAQYAIESGDYNILFYAAEAMGINDLATVFIYFKPEDEAIRTLLQKKANGDNNEKISNDHDIRLSLRLAFEKKGHYGR